MASNAALIRKEEYELQKAINKYNSPKNPIRIQYEKLVKSGKRRFHDKSEQEVFSDVLKKMNRMENELQEKKQRIADLKRYSNVPENFNEEEINHDEFEGGRKKKTRRKNRKNKISTKKRKNKISKKKRKSKRKNKTRRNKTNNKQ